MKHGPQWSCCYSTMPGIPRLSMQSTGFQTPGGFSGPAMACPLRSVTARPDSSGASAVTIAQSSSAGTLRPSTTANSPAGGLGRTAEQRGVRREKPVLNWALNLTFGHRVISIQQEFIGKKKFVLKDDKRNKRKETREYFWALMVGYGALYESSIMHSLL